MKDIQPKHNPNNHSPDSSGKPAAAKPCVQCEDLKRIAGLTV